MSGLPYLELFVSESREHVGAAYRLLHDLEQRPLDQDLQRELMRHAHSLKGMAATMGFGSMVELAHALEDLFDVSKPRQPARSLVDECLDCLGQMIDLAAHGEPSDVPRAVSLAKRLRDSPAASRPPNGGANEHGGAVSLEETPLLEAPTERFEIEMRLDERALTSAHPTIVILGRAARLGRFETIEPARVEASTGRFDGKIRLVLHSALSRDEIQKELAQQTELEQVRVSRLSQVEPLARKEPEPIVWTRVRADLLDSVADRTRDLVLEQAHARSAIPGHDGELHRHLERSEFMLRELHQTVTELRLIPFDSVAQRIQRVVGPLARQLGKQAAIEIEGREVQLDRALLDALAEPLLHMVRNALDHGIEAPSERRAAGKPAFGALQLRLERNGASIVVSLTDDGRGLRQDALRRSAIERGLMDADEAGRMSDSELGMLTTLPGVSTATRLSDVSGRGVGMDVVRSTVERLGGRLRVSSEAGRGTSIRLTLPANTALIQALLVRCAGELYALPIQALRGVVTVDRPAPEASTSIAALLGLAAPARASRGNVCAVTLRNSSSPLTVDAVIGRRDLLVRPLPPPLNGSGPYSGAALTDDGAIALVLDPEQLAPLAGG